MPKHVSAIICIRCLSKLFETLRFGGKFKRLCLINGIVYWYNLNKTSFWFFCTIMSRIMYPISSTASECIRWWFFICIFCRQSSWNRNGKRLIVNCLSSSTSTSAPPFCSSRSSSILDLTASCTAYWCFSISPLKTACVMWALGKRQRFVLVTSVTLQHFNQFRLPVSSSNTTGVAPVLSGLSENPHSRHCTAASIGDHRATLHDTCFVGAPQQAKACCARHCSWAKRALQSCHIRRARHIYCRTFATDVRTWTSRLLCGRIASVSIFADIVCTLCCDGLTNLALQTKRQQMSVLRR